MNEGAKFAMVFLSVLLMGLGAWDAAEQLKSGEEFHWFLPGILIGIGLILPFLKSVPGAKTASDSDANILPGGNGLGGVDVGSGD